MQIYSGNFFEAFDLIVFGTFTKIISDNFFGNDHFNLMLALSAFASAYIIGFVGAVVLGSYLDHACQRKRLHISFALTAIGYLLDRNRSDLRNDWNLCDRPPRCSTIDPGILVGSETGGVNAYLLEIATKGRNAFYVCWNATSFHIATLSAIFLGFIMDK